MFFCICCDFVLLMLLLTNGVRQGGVLFPQLFNVYIDGLSDIFNKSTIGGSLGGNV